MSLPEKIRRETEVQHQFLEQIPLLQQLTSDSLTQPVYQHIISKFYSFFFALEQEVGLFKKDLTNYLPDLDQRRKADLLAQDFYALQGNMPSRSHLSNSDFLPTVGSAAYALGCLYVMEGSTLGGKIIAAHMQKKLGLSYQSGLTFFYGYGKNTGEKWSAFKTALVSFAEQNPAEEALVIDAANQTFLKFSTWLSC